MAESNDINVLLLEIKSDEIGDVYRAVTQKALQWATAGFIVYGNRLLEELWSYKLEHFSDIRQEDKAFQIMWDVAEAFPANIPFPLANTKSIEDGSSEDLMSTFARYLARSPELPQAPTTADDWLTVIKSYDKEIEESENPDFFLITSVAILSTRLNLPDLSRKYLIKWGEARKEGELHACGFYPMYDPYTAALLVEGILAPVFDLNHKVLEEQLTLISTSLNLRMDAGRMLAFGDQSWKSILEQISVLTIKDAPSCYSQERIKSKWLGTAPATEKEIVAAEKKLGIKLPPDYRDFLKVTNGFDRPILISPPLLPVAEIALLSTVDDLASDFVAQVLDWSPDKYKDLSKDCILISASDEEEQVLLFPKKDNTWECWSLVIPGGCGEQSFPGFRYYMESQLQFLMRHDI